MSRTEQAIDAIAALGDSPDPELTRRVLAEFDVRDLVAALVATGGGAGGGSQPLTVVQLPIAFDTPDITSAGILVHTPTVGELLWGYISAVSITTAFNGDSPSIAIGTQAQRLTNGYPMFLPAGVADSDAGGDGSMFQFPAVAVAGNFRFATTAPIFVWLADGTGSGDPESTEGAGKVILAIGAAS